MCACECLYVFSEIYSDIEPRHEERSGNPHAPRENTGMENDWQLTNLERI